MTNFFSRRLLHFKTWWRAPATARDRAIGALVGAMGGFWLGLLARAALGPMPVSLWELGLFALGGVALGACLGRVFPKLTACVLFPLATFGGGPS